MHKLNNVLVTNESKKKSHGKLEHIVKQKYQNVWDAGKAGLRERAVNTNL